MTSQPHLHFLAGASGDPCFWQAVADQLQPDYPHYCLQAYPAFAGHANPQNIQSFDALCRWVVDQIQQPSIVIAQSMGGIFAIQAALQKPQLIKALVLCATSGGLDLTPFQVKDWRQDYQQLLPDVPDWFIQAKVDLSPEFHRINIPVLLLWGDADEISPVSIAEYLQQQLPDPELHIIPSGQHDFAKIHADMVASYIQKFLIKHIDDV
ncbi:alpha/beta fold hydrolase [Acinetobacter puyangensis]|uniref:alpha/beta fold hydrolase n=1 Tax=Acinetobacter puyangensis TaxID=1096779 RepID=UPI003A4E4306